MDCEDSALTMWETVAPQLQKCGGVVLERSRVGDSQAPKESRRSSTLHQVETLGVHHVLIKYGATGTDDAGEEEESCGTSKRLKFSWLSKQCDQRGKLVLTISLKKCGKW